MTAVQPGNLKLIGRATYLIQSHVNAVLASEAWQKNNPKHAPVGYADINAVLFDSIQARRSDPALASSPEVELSIVRILESLRPVSYTHLDVYKRQVAGRLTGHAGRAARGLSLIHI